MTRGEGRRHAFSETLEEHNTAVKDLRERRSVITASTRLEIRSNAQDLFEASTSSHHEASARSLFTLVLALFVTAAPRAFADR